jgi:colanic acid/amylovoran biosynthesis glycosyltransferase
MDLGCPADKVHVLHLGVDVANIAYQPRYWRPGEPLKILLAASFVEKKGLPYALEALAHLQHEVDLQITIIGDARQEPQSLMEKEKILTILNSSQLASQTRLLGYQPQEKLFEEAYQHHLFLSPSVTAVSGDTEGGAPVSLIDMSATGMPIISTTHCDIPEVVKHGETGLLAPERDVEGLINHLRQFIQNPQLFYEMGKNGRLHMEQAYNAPQQSQLLANFYYQLRPHKI